MLDAPPHHVSAEETIEIGKDFDFLVLFTSTPGFPGDIKLAARMKHANPKLKVCFGWSPRDDPSREVARPTDKQSISSCAASSTTLPWNTPMASHSSEILGCAVSRSRRKSDLS